MRAVIVYFDKAIATWSPLKNNCLPRTRSASRVYVIGAGVHLYVCLYVCNYVCDQGFFQDFPRGGGGGGGGGCISAFLK